MNAFEDYQPIFYPYSLALMEEAARHPELYYNAKEDLTPYDE